jgi:hypothetical protein
LLVIYIALHLYLIGLLARICSPCSHLCWVEIVDTPVVSWSQILRVNTSIKTQHGSQTWFAGEFTSNISMIFPLISQPWLPKGKPTATGGRGWWTDSQ